jgi:hypothetical protein
VKHFKIIGQVIMTLALLAGSAYALRPETRLEVDFTSGEYQDKSSAASSTHSVTGMGYAYSVLGLGDDPKWTTHCTTRTYEGTDGIAAYAASITSSTVQRGMRGISNNGEWIAGCPNPKIVIHDLATSATAQVRIEYGVRKNR